MPSPTIDQAPFKINLQIVVPVFVALGFGAFVVATYWWQVQQNTSDIADLKAFDRSCALELKSNSIEAAQMKSDIKHIKVAVDEIKDHVINWVEK